MFEYLVWGFGGITLVLVLIIGSIAEKRAEKRAKKEIQAKVEATIAAVRTNHDFDAADLYLNPKDHTGIAIDLTWGKLLLLRDGSETCVGFEQLISVELFEDSVSLVHTNRGSQVGGVIVGGLLAGGVGAVVGGLSGSRRSSEKVRKLVLKIITDDFNDPNHEVTFLLHSFGEPSLNRRHPIYKEALENASLWHSRLTTIMKRTATGKMPEAEGAMIEHQRLDAAEDKRGSPADEIRKLWELREQGVISDEEFEEMKSNIISS